MKQSHAKPNNWLVAGVFFLFFFGIFYWNFQKYLDFDIWFHVRSGEIIAQQGIVYHDVFAHTTQGREWFPHEWLFELVMYWVHAIGGMTLVRVVSSVTVAGVGMMFYRILRDFVKADRLSAYITTGLLFVSVSEFLTQRPQVWGQVFLLLQLYGLLAYFIAGKKWGLALGILVTWVWANSHGSVFLAPLLAVGFTLLAGLYKEWVKVKILTVVTVLTGLATILPPLGTLQYRMALVFMREASTINKFVDEWVPLVYKPMGFVVYTLTLLIVVAIFSWVVWKRKMWKQMGWIWMLTPLLITGYLASRNVFFGYLTLGFMVVVLVQKLMAVKKWLWLVVVGVSGLYGWGMLRGSADMEVYQRYYPFGAVKFLQTHHVNGNMFNEYGYGGYLLYKLYPDYKVFIDGRTDLYLCCEIPEELNLALNKYKEDDEYKKDLYGFFEKHDISFAILNTQKNTLMRKFARILHDDPDWRLIYWDDASQIFVRNDQENAGVIAAFGVRVATPYNQDPYLKGQEDQAMVEYQRMIQTADSAKSRNTIGYLYLKKGDLVAAKKEFDQAIVLAPWEESAYMNLGEIAVHDGDITKAIQLYRRAIELAQDRGFGYIRLGQILSASGQTDEAKQVWRSGLELVIDESARKQLMELVAN